MDDLFLSVEEFANKKNVNPETVRRWCRAGKVRGQLTKTQHGMQYMIPVTELNTQDGQLVTAPQLPAAVVDQLAQAMASKNAVVITEALQQFTAAIPQVVEAAVAAKTATLEQKMDAQAEDNRQLRAELDGHFRQVDEKLAAAANRPIVIKESGKAFEIVVLAAVFFMTGMVVWEFFLKKLIFGP